MERSTPTKWLNDLKISLIENDHQKIYELVIDIPDFDSFEQAKEAKSMIETALEVFHKEKNEAKKNMNNIKKMKEFLVQNHKSKFDKKS